MMISIKKHIPFRFKWFIRKIKYFGNKYYCNVCNSNLSKFKSGGINQPIINEFEIVGAGYRQADFCPVCKASYRQRFQYLFFQEMRVLSKEEKMLHIAPEECFSNIFREKLGNKYFSGDLEPERYSYYTRAIKVDLTQIDFPSESFDILICNHVLEHITDDLKAMREIFRILKPNGMALIQVPISLKLSSTYEDSGIISPDERLVKFGQKDHVRIYAKDFKERLKKAGFQVKTYNTKEFDNYKHFEKLALDHRETLFVCLKINN